MNIHKIIRITIIIICFVLVIAIPFIIQNHNSIKIGSVSSKNIKSFVICDIADGPKDVSNKEDREKIINLINSVKITKYNVTPRTGCAFSVEITYSDNRKFEANFLSSTVSYSTNNSRATWCNIDRDIIDDLQKYYDEN